MDAKSDWERVDEAVEEVGDGRSSDKEEICDWIDLLTTHLETLKANVISGDAGPISVKHEQFRHLEPRYVVGTDTPHHYDQIGPVVRRILILDWRDAK